ncbi:MAG: branched-chain amino acid ABC transporter permease [Treponema sp.]|nr:branched-chain amino acid ABC transporter permease [Treponema sp.]
MSYLLVVGVTIAIYAVLTVALNMVVGYVGQPNLAQSAFLGLGAYFAAVLSTRYHLGFWWTIPVAFGVAGIAGFALGAISLRLREDFLAITTIGLNFVMVAVFQYLPFFGGAVGIYSIPVPSIGEHHFGNLDYLILAAAMLALVVGVSKYLERSWLGASLFAIRDDESAAASVGIPVASYKVVAFTLSAAFAGMVGSLYAPFLSAVTPTSFGFTESVVILSMLIFGGLGTVRGALLGALVLGALPEAFRFISNFRLLTYGVILLLMLRFQPQGLAGEASAVSRLVGRLASPLRKSRDHGPA